MTPELNDMNVLASTLTEAVRAAVGSGDLTEVHRLLDHATEEDTHGLPWDWLLAVVVLKLRAEAEQQGRPGLAAEYGRMVSAKCSPETIYWVAVTSLLILGRRRGGLQAAEYDRAVALAQDEFPELLPELRQLSPQ